MLLGNKSDLKNHCQVSRCCNLNSCKLRLLIDLLVNTMQPEKLDSLLNDTKRENGKPFFLFHQEVSAKTGQGNALLCSTILVLNFLLHRSNLIEGVSRDPTDALPQVALACTKFEVH